MHSNSGSAVSDPNMQNITKRSLVPHTAHSIGFRSCATSNVASVFSLISSTVTPGACSVRVRVPFLRSTWKTHCAQNKSAIALSLRGRKNSRDR